MKGLTLFLPRKKWRETERQSETKAATDETRFRPQVINQVVWRPSQGKKNSIGRLNEKGPALQGRTVLGYFGT